MIRPGFIQVAGVVDQNEANMLVRCGVEYLGFPLRLPVHKQDLSEADAASIIRALRPPAAGILITYLDRADAILDFCAFLGASIVQLHGDIAGAELKIIKQSNPQLDIIKSLVIGLHSMNELRRTVLDSAPYVDAFITDTFDPGTGASGATGKTHDWALSRQLVECSPRPVILAGGLNPDNVREAIHAVRPYGVDAHNGLEDASGRKRESKVRAFMKEATEAFDDLSRSEGRSPRSGI